MPIVQDNSFSPVCPLPHYFHLGISRHVLGTYYTCIGHILRVLGRYVIFYMTLGTCYLECCVLLGACNMRGYGCKTCQSERKTRQMADSGGKIVALTLVLTALTTVCICNVRAECVAVLLMCIPKGPTRKNFQTLRHSHKVQMWVLQPASSFLSSEAGEPQEFRSQHLA
jgi:hypothetical protein